MATTFTKTTATWAADNIVAGKPWDGIRKPYIMKEVITLNATNFPGGWATADIIQCLDIPADVIVRDVMLNITTAFDSTAGGATATVTVGDATTANGFETSANIAVAGWYRTIAGDTNGALDGKLYTVADTIDMVITTNATLTEGVVEVFALCYDMS